MKATARRRISAIRRWNVGNWSLKDQSQRLNDQVYSLACDASGKYLVSGDSSARVTVWQTDPLRPAASTINVNQGEADAWSVAIDGFSARHSVGQFGWPCLSLDSQCGWLD